MNSLSHIFACVCVLSLCVSTSVALQNGLGLTPAMGYNTWNDYNCDITADDVMQSADAMISQGLNKVGYEYVNIDDCWQISRDPTTGVIVPDPQAFPDGIAPVADYVHSLGLKFGIYTDRGTNTCQGRPGSLNYEQIDAETYASWGVDYVKEDSCYASSDHNVAFQEYGTFRDALNSTGRPIYFSLCGWANWYAPEGASLGNSWRIAGDCTDWSSVLNAMNINNDLGQYAGPGGWNDPDMLIGSAKVTAFSLSPARSRTMFSVWCVMAAPLLIGSNIRNLSSWDLETYTNSELIAVDQDLLGFQGFRLAGGALHDYNWGTNIWGKKLLNGNWVLVFLNNEVSPLSITCDSACFAQMNFSSPMVAVRDLWTHTNNGTVPVGSYTAKDVPPFGASVTVLFSPAY